MSTERPPSVLFGVRMPEPGVLTAGQRWTAALAVLLAALLLVSTDGGRTLVTAPAPSATPAAAAPTTATTLALPTAPTPMSPTPAATTPLTPTFDLGPSPAPTPAEPAPGSPPSGGDEAPPPDGEEPPACPVPVPPVLAGAGLCPQA